jgi:hypothetical protein
MSAEKYSIEKPPSIKTTIETISRELLDSLKTMFERYIQQHTITSIKPIKNLSFYLNTNGVLTFNKITKGGGQLLCSCSSIYFSK